MQTQKLVRPRHVRCDLEQGGQAQTFCGFVLIDRLTAWAVFKLRQWRCVALGRLPTSMPTCRSSESPVTLSAYYLGCIRMHLSVGANLGRPIVLQRVTPGTAKSHCSGSPANVRTRPLAPQQSMSASHSIISRCLDARNRWQTVPVCLGQVYTNRSARCTLGLFKLHSDSNTLRAATRGRTPCQPLVTTSHDQGWSSDHDPV